MENNKNKQENIKKQVKSPNKPEDRRIKMTRKLLEAALIELLEDKPIEKITATELCEQADINRNTFYTHYSDPTEVLYEIENQIYQKLEHTIIKSVENGDIGVLLDEICREIKANPVLCTIILSNNSENNLLSRLIATAHNKTIAEWHQLDKKIPNDELECYFNFAAGGSMAVIKKWLDDKLVDSPEKIANLLKKINSYIPLSLIKKTYYYNK